MICLHFTAKKTSDGVQLDVDRLEREDASPEEAKIIDSVHDILKVMFEAQNVRVDEIKKPWWKRFAR